MIIALTGAGISKESGIDTFTDRPHIRDYLTREYATFHPEEYRKVIADMKKSMSGAVPNDAHIALAEYNIPVITMNIDGLHELCHTKHLIAVHGRMPTEIEMPRCDKLRGVPVLYGDPAPRYQDAFNLVSRMEHGDVLLVVGTSKQTSFCDNLLSLLKTYGVEIVDIEDNASTKVRKYLDTHKDKIETYEKYMSRPELY